MNELLRELNLFYRCIETNRENPTNTLSYYKGFLKEFFHTTQINDLENIKNLKQEDIIKYKEYLLSNGNSLSSINTKLAVIRSFFRFLVDEEILEKNIITKSVRVKVPKKIKEIPTEEEFMKMFDVIKDRKKYNTILTLFTTTGMRFSELMSLRISDFTGNVFKIKGKGSKERYVILHDEVAKMLEDYINNERKQPIILSRNTFNSLRKTVKYKGFKNYEDYLDKIEKNKDLIFLSETGCQMNDSNFNNSLKKIAEKAGINVKEKNVTAHTLRHFYATFALNNGVPLDVVQENLGHESIMTTRIYAKTTVKRRIQENINTFNPFRKEVSYV